MINLVKNELYKVKFVKIIASEIFYLIFFLIIIKFSKKSAFELSFNLIPFVGILTSLIFGGIISDEIDKGTFRFYLTKPASRHKIYVSKTLVLMGYSYISVIWIVIFTSIIGSKMDIFYVSKYLTYSIPLFVLNSIILYFSVKIRTKSFTICFAVLLFSFSLLITQFLLNMDLNFIKYTPLPYLDFTIFDDKASLALLNSTYNTNLNLKSGALIDTVYTFALFLLGFKAFLKKDIKN